MHRTGALVEEIRDISSALEVLNEKSVFIALDETFTSTNDPEGESLTYSLIKRLAAANARAVITSHYPSLQELLEDPEIENVAFSLFELYSGVSRSSIPRLEKGRILQTLSNLVVWNLDARGAETGGELDGHLSSKGERLDPVDSMIAGIALSRGEAILTRNVRHFSRIPGLRIETY